MVKSGFGQGVMRNKGGLILILVARVYTTIRVQTLALWDRVHHLSAVFVARGTVSWRGRWRERRGVSLALGDGDAGIPWIVGTASICGREVSSVSVRPLYTGGSSWMEGSKGGGEAHVECPDNGNERDKREKKWTHNRLAMGLAVRLEIGGKSVDPQVQTAYPTASALPRGR
jgi:hypothetical protein